MTERSGCVLFQAAVLFNAAAESGHLAAIYNMALCFEHGKGVGKNLVKVMLFSLHFMD